MHMIANVKRRISLGWLALVCLVASAALFGFILSVTFPRLRQFSGGIDPFDSRFWGYSLSEAQALLVALGASGRDYYANVQLWVDTFYPASYGLSRALCLYWLALPLRATRDGFAVPIKVYLLALPCVVMILDWSENGAISTMLATWQQLDASQVAGASQLSFLKSAGTMITDTILLLMFVMYRVNRFLGRSASSSI